MALKPRMPARRPTPRPAAAKPKPKAYPRPHPDLLPKKPKTPYGTVVGARMKDPKVPSGGSGGSNGGLGKGFWKGVAVGTTATAGAREYSDYEGRSDKSQNYWQWNKGGRK